MEHVATTGWLHRSSGQNVTIDLLGKVAISARVRFRGASDYTTETANSAPSGSSGSRTGGSNITLDIPLPDPPAGYAFHSCFASASVYAEQDGNWSVRAGPDTKSGHGSGGGVSFTQSGRPANIPFSAYHEHPYSYTFYTYTTGIRQTETARSVNPKLGDVQHVGTLSDGQVTDWFSIDLQSNILVSLPVSVSGSGRVYVEVEYTYALLMLPAPERVSPGPNERTTDRRPWFTFKLTGNSYNSASKYHARIRIGSNVSLVPPLYDLRSQTGAEWEYLSGEIWQPFPPEGVSPGTTVRVRPPVLLPYGIYYWDCASHDGDAFGENANPISLRVLVTVSRLYTLVHNDVDLTKVISLSIVETANGKIGEISFSIDNQNGASNALIRYGDTILAAVNDTMGNVDEFRGIVKAKKPHGAQLDVSCTTGDGILSERIIKQDYPNQDIGLTVKHIIENYCQPLTAGRVNTATGITAPVTSTNLRPIQVLESLRKDYPVLYAIDKDWDMLFDLTESLHEPTVTIRAGEISG